MAWKLNSSHPQTSTCLPKRLKHTLPKSVLPGNLAATLSILLLGFFALNIRQGREASNTIEKKKISQFLKTVTKEKNQSETEKVASVHIILNISRG